MQDFSSTKAFYTSDLLHKWKLLPFIAKADDLPFTCNMCGYVNAHVNKFCTNCGYPSKPLSHLVGEYNFRLFKQKQLIKNYQITIARARVTLYIMSAICAAGFGAVFLHFEKHPTRGIVLLIFSSVMSAAYFSGLLWAIAHALINNPTIPANFFIINLV